MPAIITVVMTGCDLTTTPQVEAQPPSRTIAKSEVPADVQLWRNGYTILGGRRVGLGEEDDRP